jgi:hypothetical protein
MADLRAFNVTGGILTLMDNLTWQVSDSEITELSAVWTGTINSPRILVVGGYFSSSVAWADLRVFKLNTSKQLEYEMNKSWLNVSAKGIDVGNLNQDSNLEIVVNGIYSDGTNSFEEISVFNITGSSIEFVASTSWPFQNYQYLTDVKVSDIDGDSRNEIIWIGYNFTGAAISSDVRIFELFNDQLIEQTNTTWTSSMGAFAMSGYVSDVDGDSEPELMTVGTFFEPGQALAEIRIFNVTR